MPTPLTATLGAFASGLRYDAVPQAAYEAVHIGFTDGIAPRGSHPSSMLVPATLAECEGWRSAADAASYRAILTRGKLTRSRSRL